MRIDLIPITHEQLCLFCKLGGWVFVHNDFIFEDRPDCFSISRPRGHPMRGDVYLIGAYRETFAQIPIEQKQLLRQESINYAKGRHDTWSPKNNARILVLWP